ncbi:hypothetical protein EDB89DRAFT_1913234 [Lactarius sanguifluus]|nr:hypothetical protein EDB89DRAFT_1913234 [Lactarius sanguifluus]
MRWTRTVKRECEVIGSMTIIACTICGGYIETWSTKASAKVQSGKRCPKEEQGGRSLLATSDYLGKRRGALQKPSGEYPARSIKLVLRNLGWKVKGPVTMVAHREDTAQLFAIGSTSEGLTRPVLKHDPKMRAFRCIRTSESERKDLWSMAQSQRRHTVEDTAQLPQVIMHHISRLCDW